MQSEAEERLEMTFSRYFWKIAYFIRYLLYILVEDFVGRKRKGGGGGGGGGGHGHGGDDGGKKKMMMMAMMCMKMKFMMVNRI